jgi:hypothetical protein
MTPFLQADRDSFWRKQCHILCHPAIDKLDTHRILSTMSSSRLFKTALSSDRLYALCAEYLEDLRVDSAYEEPNQESDASSTCSGSDMVVDEGPGE